MFRCALTEFDELDISVATNGSSHIAQMPVGYDENSGRRYSIFVAMDSVPGYGPERKELIFCLLEADRETEEIEQIWDGATTRRTITEAAHRRAILSAIGQMTKALIDDVKPRVVVMTTYAANLPPRALSKYNVIAGIFREEGYVAGKANVWHGRYTWMMERR